MYRKLGPLQETDQSDVITYDLKIVLAYPPGDNPEQTADDVQKIEKEVTNLFEGKYFDQGTGKWNGITLKQCMSISEDNLPVSQARLLTQWLLEYMTTRADEDQVGPLT